MRKFKSLQIIILLILFSFIIISCGSGGSGGNESDNPQSEITKSGQLDKGFGIDGVITTQVSGYYDDPKDIIIQRDGKIIVVGESFNGNNSSFILVRYDSSGRIDNTYGNAGMASVTITIGGAMTSLGGAVLQSDDKTVLAGCAFNGADNDIIIARFGTDGVLDQTFGVNGIYRSQIGSNECAYAVAIQNDGKIVVGGFAENKVNGDSDFLLARYTTAGIPDLSFGTNGVVTSPLLHNSYGSYYGNFYTIAIASDGAIIAAGQKTIDYQTSSFSSLAIARYHQDGSIDVNFGTQGFSFYGDWARDITLQSDGKIVVASYYFSGDHLCLIRFDQSGNTDTLFGTNGSALAVIGNHKAYSQALAMQGDGKLIAAGSAADQTGNSNFAIARFTADGILDKTFAEGGSVITKIGTGFSWINAVAIQPDGKIVAVGLVEVGSIKAFGIARYHL